MNLIRNAIRTPDGTLIESKYRHDFVTYVDSITGLTYMVDGGLDYCRRSCNGDEINECLHDDEPHEVQRQILKWGSYGVTGKEPLKRIPIAEMEDAHIKAVLKECNPKDVLKNCMEKELEFRNAL